MLLYIIHLLPTNTEDSKDSTEKSRESSNQDSAADGEKQDDLVSDVIPELLRFYVEKMKLDRNFPDHPCDSGRYSWIERKCPQDSLGEQHKLVIKITSEKMIPGSTREMMNEVSVYSRFKGCETQCSNIAVMLSWGESEEPERVIIIMPDYGVNFLEYLKKIELKQRIFQDFYCKWPRL